MVGAQGRIEPADGLVSVGAMPGEVLTDLLVSLGDSVEAGTEVARLKGEELRALEYEAACLQRDESRARVEAQRAVATATLAEADVGVEQAAAAELECVAQEAKIEAARENARIAHQEVARLTGLEPRLVPEQALVRKHQLAAQADLEIRLQQMALERMVSAASLGRRVAAARRESARANLVLAEAAGSLTGLEKAAEAARLRRDGARVLAPIAGRVIDIGMREGEVVGRLPIMRIADVSRMQVIAEVYETDVQSLRVGQRAEARSRAIDGVIKGRIAQIGTLVSPRDLQELGMPATPERRVVDVRIDIDDPGPAASLIHLQVAVDFLDMEASTPSERTGTP